jgi:hypothetical protein
MNAMSNTSTRADLMKALTKLGADAGKGAQSRTAYCVELCRASVAGTITEKDAAECYAAYLKGKDAAQSLLVDGKAATEKTAGVDARDTFRAFTESDTVQASKFNVFIKLGKIPATVCPFPVDVLNTAGRIVAEIMSQPTGDGEKKAKIKTFESIQKVAQVQMKHPRTLTEDEMRDIIIGTEPEAKEPKTEKELLAAQVKAMQGIRDGKVAKDGTVERAPMPSKALEVSIAWLENRIAEITAEESNAKLSLMAMMPTTLIKAVA